MPTPQQEKSLFVEQAGKPVADIGAVLHPRRIPAQNNILNKLNLFCDRPV
jgi:hypothetical protein